MVFYSFNLTYSLSQIKNVDCYLFLQHNPTIPGTSQPSALFMVLPFRLHDKTISDVLDKRRKMEIAPSNAESEFKY